MNNLLTVKEAAELLHVTEWTVRTQYIAKGRLKADKIGNTFVIPREELEKFMLSNTIDHLDAKTLQTLEHIIQKQKQIVEQFPELKDDMKYLKKLIDGRPKK